MVVWRDLEHKKCEIRTNSMIVDSLVEKNILILGVYSKNIQMWEVRKDEQGEVVDLKMLQSVHNSFGSPIQRIGMT